MKREVGGLKVHCVNKKEGCNWKGEVRDLEVVSYVKVPRLWENGQKQ